MIHTSTQLTPFGVDLGCHPKTPYSFITEDTQVVKTVESLLDELEALQHQVDDYLEHARPLQAKEANKGRLRPKVLNVDQSIMLSTWYNQPALMRTTGSRKLPVEYIEPFAIVKRVSPTSYELDLPHTTKFTQLSTWNILRSSTPIRSDS